MELKVFCYTGPEREPSLTLQNCLKQSPCWFFGGGGGVESKSSGPVKFQIDWIFWGLE